jgi:multidrug efflux pump subunit AcrB
MKESWGEVQGARGNFRVSFEPGTNIKVRQLEMQRIAIDLARDQPENTIINVETQDSSAMSRFVMIVQVTGGDDDNALRTLVDERLQPRIASVKGISSVFIAGGAPEEVTVRIDPDRCADMGVSPSDVTNALVRSVHRFRFLGGLEKGSRKIPVMLDGRPGGVHVIGETRISDNKPVLIRHVADIELSTGRKDTIFRVNGKASVGLIILKEEGANLVELGKSVKERLDLLREELSTYGIDFVVGFDAADEVNKQIDRLKKLGMSGSGEPSCCTGNALCG